MRLATFDIFDTALIRTCGDPEAVFGLMALELWPDDEALRTAYVIRRRQAAIMAGNNASLDDIYATFGKKEFASYTRDDLRKAELDMERRMLSANLTIRDEIARLRADGYTIKFLSDMYLPSDFLSEILKREGCMVNGEEVIVSCEWSARKDDGSLYKKVRKKYSPSTWIHHGDNRHSDIRMARKNHVKAVRIDSGFTPIEHRVAALRRDTRDRDAIMASLAAGTMRRSRLDGASSAAATLAADYVGALYIPFVAYVLRTAKRNGITRLHFLSRDGYIMQQIAHELDHDGIELNYLFVSRRSLLLAYLAEDSENRYVATSDRKNLIMRSVDSLLSRLQTSRKELQEACGITFDYDKILSPTRERQFLDTLFNHPRVTPWLKERIKEKSGLTLEYLRQEGLTDGSRQAMVDIGWLGTTRLMINSILGLGTDSSSPAIPTFYVGVRTDVYPRVYGDFHSFFPLGSLDTAATALIENYYSASPYPSTVGYAESDGRIIPVFPDGQSFQQTDTVKNNLTGVLNMSRNLSRWIDSMSDDFLYRWAKTSVESIATLRDNIDLSPLMTTAEFDGVPMASRLSFTQLVNIIALGGRHTAFDRGSLSLTIGHRLTSPLWQIHGFTSRLRAAIYKRWILHS